MSGAEIWDEDTERASEADFPPWAQGLGAVRNAPADARTQALDEDAKRAALGPLIRRVGYSTEARLRYLLGGSLALGGSLVLALLLILAGPGAPDRTKRGAKRPARAQTVGITRDPRALVIPVAAPFGVYAFIRLFLLFGVRAQLHARGLVVTRFGRREVVRWNEVKIVRSWVYRIIGGDADGTYGFVTLEHDGGKTKLTEDIDDLPGVRSLIQRATFQELYPAVHAALGASHAVPFGPLTISREGLSRGGELRRWAEIESASTWEGKFTVKLTGKTFSWFSVKTKHIPNAHVFMAALEDFRHG